MCSYSLRWLPIWRGLFMLSKSSCIKLSICADKFEANFIRSRCRTFPNRAALQITIVIILWRHQLWNSYRKSRWWIIIKLWLRINTCTRQICVDSSLDSSIWSKFAQTWGATDTLMMVKLFLVVMRLGLLVLNFCTLRSHLDASIHGCSGFLTALSRWLLLLW